MGFIIFSAASLEQFPSSVKYLSAGGISSWKTVPVLPCLWLTVVNEQDRVNQELMHGISPTCPCGFEISPPKDETVKRLLKWASQQI